MTFKEIAEKIDKSEKNRDWIDFDHLFYEFNIPETYVDDDEIRTKRLTAYWIGRWLCTDSWVGYRMYFLDDEPVGVSTQKGRKCEEGFEWFSDEAANKVKDFLYELYKANNELRINITDINDDIGNGYSIAFSSQVLDWTKAMYKGEKITFIERIKETPDYGIDTKIKAQLPSGETTIIDIKDIEFAFNLGK
jgi:hypothetical protein